MTNDLKLNLYEQMARIRVLEESLLYLFSEGKIAGTIHTYTGQEAVSTACLAHRKVKDAVFSNHRCHGHYISFGGDVQSLISEIIGNKSGTCAGRGGSQHLCLDCFFTNGIQGGMLPNAAGYALAYKLRGENNIAMAFIGDGTWGEGIVYETLNMASLWDIPLLIIVEDNGYAQTTPSQVGRAGNIYDRVKSFNIESSEIESNDVVELYDAFSSAFYYVREKRRPYCQIIHTYRLGPHSKGDDFRPKEEIEQWRKKDPLVIAEKYINNNDATLILETEKKAIAGYIESALKDMPERIDDLDFGITTVYRDQSCNQVLPILSDSAKVLDSLNAALHLILESHDEAIIMGEDIADPYGGAFKVTKGLSTAFPKKVITTPISEAGIAGIATGLSLNKMRVIVEVMFGDFITLMYDQIINHGAKFKWMYNNKVTTPVLYRTPTGGKRGYGPTHSQSLERIFYGIPNVTVVAPTHYHNPGQLLLNIFNTMDTPVIFVENKALYMEKIIISNNGKADNFFITTEGVLLPTIRLAPESTNAQATIICYGGGIVSVLEAAWEIMLEEEINVEVVCPSLISPLPITDIYSLISSESIYILVIDESISDFGWSAEVALRIRELDDINNIMRGIERLGTSKTFISSSKQVENTMYPSKTDITKKINKFLRLYSS